LIYDSSLDHLQNPFKIPRATIVRKRASDLKAEIALILILTLGFANLDAVHAVQSAIAIQPSTADTYANSFDVTIHRGPGHGEDLGMFVGNCYFAPEKLYGTARSYVRFNLTEIPSEVEIVNAFLKLYMYSAPTSPQIYEAYRITSDWSEHWLNWTVQPTYASYPTNQTTINPTPSTGWISWDITEDVKAWYSGSFPNYGTMLKINFERNASDEVAAFYPREISFQDLRPKLEVTFESEVPIPELQPLMLTAVIALALTLTLFSIRRKQRNLTTLPSSQDR